MPRKIGANVQNELKIQDPVSGSTITFFYRIPTAEERVGYHSAQFERTKDTVRIRTTEARQEYGLKILTGFKEGDFEHQKEGKWVAFSHDPSSPNFDPEWKDLIQKFSSDLVEVLAFHAFEGQRVSSAQTAEVLTEKN